MQNRARATAKRAPSQAKRPLAKVSGRIAFLVDDMFEDSEFRVPFDRLQAEGYEVVVVGKEAGSRLKGKKGKEHVVTQRAIADVAAEDVAAIVIPGGYSPDRLRTDERMVALTRAVFEAGKPVAAICHAGWMLAEADIVDDRTLTSWPSIKTDLCNAGAYWIDREVVEDGNLITSRKPDDLDAFTDAIVRQLEGQVPPRFERPDSEPRGEGQPTLH